MLQLHSASDEAISYLQSFAQKRHKRNHFKKNDTPETDSLLQIKITRLEEKIIAYQTDKECALDKILQILG